MTEPLTDVMVDVVPGITVYRQGGKWFWTATQKPGHPDVTLEDVLRELAYQAQRLNFRSALVQEALEGLQKSTTQS